MTFLVKNFALASLAAAALVACGGGGDSSSSSETRKLNGVVAVGDGLEGAEVAFKCESNSPATVLSQEGGVYSVDLSQATLPCEITASLNGTNLKSFTDQSTGTANVTTITTLIYDLATKDGGKVESAKDLAAAFESFKKVLKPLASAANVDISVFDSEDPFTSPFKANKADALDVVMDRFAEANLNLDNLQNVFNQIDANQDQEDIDTTVKALIESLPEEQQIIKLPDAPAVTNNDPRYGHGGKVLKSIDVVEEERKLAPQDYTVSGAGFFVFEVSNLEDFATGQYVNAAKIAKSSTDFGYAFGLDFFSAKTTDGWKTSSWSYKNNDNHYGQAFLNGQLLTTCKEHPYQAAGSELQVIAFSEAAQVVKNLSELNGKTFTEYSCGVDDNEWSDFEDNGKTPFDHTETFQVENGYVVGMDEGDEVNVKIPVANLFSGNLFTEKDDHDGSVWSTYATAYKLGEKYFILMKDKDSTRKDNSSQYGLTLAVSN